MRQADYGDLASEIEERLTLTDDTDDIPTKKKGYYGVVYDYFYEEKLVIFIVNRDRNYTEK